MNHIVDKSGSMSRALANEISSGVYRENEKLPGERKLCELFKVSRTTVRAVLNDFSRNGILIIKPRSGACVSEKAIEIIQQELNKPLLRVFFIMPPRQQINPLIRKVFSTFLKYIDTKIQASILFQNELTENIPYLKIDDVAVVFGINDKKQYEILDAQVSKLIILNKKDDKYDYISPDNYSGGKLMAEYLLEAGHRKIWCPFFKEKNRDSDFNNRYQGLKDTLEKSGAVLDTFFIPPDHEFVPEIYAEALGQLLNKRNDISAIACMSDKMAMNIYAQMNSHEIKVADDISVVSFDDQYYAQYTCPPLSTVKYPAEAMGIHLATFLNEYLVGDAKKIKKIIEPILIKRQSVIKPQRKEKE
ncbi:MAG: substrate-binding domain-containing protein [Lentisphaerota bacterium]